MKKSLIIIFLIIIIMPITVLAVMAFSASRENRMREMEERETVAAQYLNSQSRLLSNRLGSIESELLSTEGDLREISRNNRLVRQAFEISGDNSFLYPDAEAALSERETSFLREAENIELASALRAAHSPDEEGSIKSNWYTWFMGDGINFIVYSIDGDLIKGYLLERYALISQLINMLPHSASEEESFRVLLTDARGDVLYQWGAYITEDRDMPIATLSPGEPLGSWRLLYYYNSSVYEKSNNLRTLYLLSGVGLFTILILVLSIYFFRENSREMRTARNQVTFVNQVSHELKTPLTNIRLYSELLEPRLQMDEDRAYLDVIIREGSRLGRMINNVLTFSRGERGELKANTGPVNLKELIDEVLNKFSPLLREKGMEVEYETVGTAIVETDRDMVEQILINLISNAVKYGNEGKYLGIGISEDEGRYTVTVKDKGPGIPTGEREKIFNPFYRLDNSLSQSTSGTGIGLSIARKLAAETGSELRYVPTGSGACFSLSLPERNREKDKRQ